jgi:hypothetical protein
MIGRLKASLWIVFGMLFCLTMLALTAQTKRLDSVKADLATANTELTRVRGLLGTSESARQAEREQCAQDFAGEVERAKIEVAKASKAAVARSQITGICPRASTRAERIAALRANSGETK